MQRAAAVQSRRGALSSRLKAKRYSPLHSFTCASWISSRHLSLPPPPSPPLFIPTAYRNKFLCRRDARLLHRVSVMNSTEVSRTCRVLIYIYWILTFAIRI